MPTSILAARTMPSLFTLAAKGKAAEIVAAAEKQWAARPIIAIEQWGDTPVLTMRPRGGEKLPEEFSEYCRQEAHKIGMGFVLT